MKDNVMGEYTAAETSRRTADGYTAKPGEYCVGVDFSVGWDNLDERVVCSQEFYEGFTGWLVFDRKNATGSKNPGKTGTPNVLMGHVTHALQRARDKFGGSRNDDTMSFFDQVREGGRFTVGLKKNIVSDQFKRSAAAGEKMDNSAEPIGQYMIKQIIAAYQKDGSDEAIERKFAAICAWQGGARSAEISFLCNLVWDFDLNTVVAESPMSKR